MVPSVAENTLQAAPLTLNSRFRSHHEALLRSSLGEQGEYSAVHGFPSVTGRCAMRLRSAGQLHVRSPKSRGTHMMIRNATLAVALAVFITACGSLEKKRLCCSIREIQRNKSLQ